MQLEPGTILGGRYRVERPIGRGAQGVVYRALDCRLRRLVAVKVLEDVQPGQEVAQRLRAEARALARLRHPGIVRCLDTGTEAGRPYMVVEYVEGAALSSLLRDHGRVSVEAALEIGRQAGEALVYAHARGVVHRDIKPSNIIVDTRGHVRLADFGIASLAGRSSVTSVGGLVGTPCYMAPEQVRGEAGDHRSDIYALGVVLYELLTGRPPFEGDIEAVLAAQIEAAPRGMRDQRSDVPPEMERVVMRALEKAPSARYQSAQALVEALTEVARACQGTWPLSQEQGKAGSGVDETLGSREPATDLRPAHMYMSAVFHVGLFVLLSALLLALLLMDDIALGPSVGTRGPGGPGLALGAAGAVGLAWLILLRRGRGFGARGRTALVQLVRFHEVHKSAEMATAEDFGCMVSSADEATILGRMPAELEMRRAAMAFSKLSLPPLAWLVVLNGPQRGKHFPIKPGTRIGRAPDNEVVLSDPLVSRHHAVIDFDNDSVLIRDLGCTNPIVVSGQRVRGSVTLHDRCELRLGDTNLMFLSICDTVTPGAARRLREFDEIWNRLERAVRDD